MQQRMGLMSSLLVLADRQHCEASIVVFEPDSCKVQKSSHAPKW